MPFVYKPDIFFPIIGILAIELRNYLNWCNQYYLVPRWVVTATGPVMLSTLEDGKVVRGLAGIPSEGPVLFVGYHMLMGFEIIPFVTQLMMERNILVRGIAHPAMFVRVKDRRPPEAEPSNFDVFRVMGAVPVSAGNFYKLMSSKSHALLYPGGVREALHRKVI